MSGFDRVLSVLGLAILFGGCSADDDDGSHVNTVDGGPVGDALGGGPLEPLASAWQFELAPPAGSLSPDKTSCDVTIGASGFDISCRPTAQELPTDVGTGCKQVLDDLHLSGSVFDHLEGAFDRRVEYRGEGCAALGFTTGAPYPLPVFATMQAVRTEERPLGPLIATLGGTWAWTRHTGRDRTTEEECLVDLDAAGTGIAVVVECPHGEWSPVVTGCERRSFSRIDATLTADALDGELRSILRHRGTTCGISYPPESGTVEATLSAWREP